MKIAEFKVRPDSDGTRADQEAFMGPGSLQGSSRDPRLLDPLKQLAEMEGTGQLDLPWLLPIEHFSASSQEMAEACPRQWQQRYIHGRKEAPGQKLVLGSLTHGGIEHGLDIKMLTGDDPKLEDVVALYHDLVWPDTIGRYGGANEIIWDDEPESVRRKGAQLVTLYHPRISYLQPESIEHEFLLDLGLPVPIKGFIDLVQANDRPLIDWKTTSKRENTMKSGWRTKGRIYQLAFNRPYDIHQITTTKAPEIISGLENDEMIEAYSPRIAKQTVRRLGETLAELNRFYVTLGPDEDWPMRGIHHPWRCSPRWCAYRKDCPAWLA